MVKDEEKTIMTKAQAKRNLRDTLMVTDFDKYDGPVSAVVERLSKKYKLSASQVRNVLKDAGRIGRVH